MNKLNFQNSNYFSNSANVSFGASKICVKQLKKLLQEDKNLKEIAAYFGVTVEAVRYQIKKHSLQMPRERLQQQFEEQVLPLIEQGISPQNIYKLTGFNSYYVRKWQLAHNSEALTKTRHNRIVELFNEHYTDEQIADILCMSEVSVKGVRQKLGCKRLVYKYVSKEKIEELIPLVSSMKELAKKLGLTTTTTRQRLKEYSLLTPMEYAAKNNEEKVLKLFDFGYTDEQIASHLKLSITAVKKIRLANGRHQYNTKYINLLKNLDSILQDLKNGMSANSILKKYDIKMSVFCKFIKKETGKTIRELKKKNTMQFSV